MPPIPRRQAPSGLTRPTSLPPHTWGASGISTGTENAPRQHLGTPSPRTKTTSCLLLAPGPCLAECPALSRGSFCPCSGRE